MSWARWKLFAYQGGSQSPYPAYRSIGADQDAGWYRPGAPPPYVPVQDIECVATDRAVCALHPVLKQTVEVYYAGRGTIQQKMRDLGIGSTKTLYYKLHDAHVCIMDSLNAMAAGLTIDAWSEPVAKKVAVGA